MRPHVDDDILRPGLPGVTGLALAASRTLLCVRVAEAGARAGEVSQLGCGGAGPAAGQARAHVTSEVTSDTGDTETGLPGTVRGVAQTVELAPVRHSLEDGPRLCRHTDLGYTKLVTNHFPNRETEMSPGS